jgi:RNA polymerase sigma-70 factor (ECF subfamily)
MSSACSSNVAELAAGGFIVARAALNFSTRRRPTVHAFTVTGTARMKTTSGDDAEYVAQLAAGDGGALRPLYERHGRALLRFSTAMCRSRQHAEDLVHDTFVELMREPGNFDAAQGSVFAYLCGVLRHRISHHYRQQRRWVALADDESPAQVHDAHLHDGTGPVEEIARSELTAAFRRAMLELPLPHREVIALCDLEELPYATVASILDCPVGTVRSRLHRARALLTIRLVSLEVVELQADLRTGMPLAQRGLP